MADARALLRAERASRRIKHPHASYTSDGKLLCNLCETLVKSEAQWQSHLHSTQHTLRSQRQQDAATIREATNDGGAKKRKAESPESQPQERKKAKAGVQGRSQGVDEEESVFRDQPPAGDATTQQTNSNSTAERKKANDIDINEADILDFERELEDLEANAAREEQQARQEAVRNAATISAAPMTAEELAAQAREEQSAQRGKRDAELEDEREDAARVLEEEFDEMEGLEERVRKLRERREKLRTEGSPDATSGDAGRAAQPNLEADANGNAREPEGSSDEDDDEDFDEWKFGGN